MSEDAAPPVNFTDTDLLEFMEQGVPFNRFLGIRVAAIEEGFARLTLPFRDEFVGDPQRPALHGGVISSLADTCGGVTVWSAAAPGSRVATVDLRIDFLLPGPLEELACDGRMLRMGNRVGVVELRVFAVNDPDSIIAAGKGVYNVWRRQPGD